MDTSDVSIDGPGCGAGAASAPEPGTATLLSIGLLIGVAGYALPKITKRAA